eukprot:TRINITY_DN3722_c0_g3_i1.p1 TRINITY_DN3722_c0_g3~~TRINITY_DN3722_c0_g3_i1.p1  ORF type:complete len:1802 (-),score=452.39 TRINITY_DN3722_c0_g3_i1:21-5426(-)
MAPLVPTMELPKKPAQEGQVDLHASHVPLSAPINFVGPRKVCFAVASNICIWDLDNNSKSYLQTSSYGITKLCTNPEKGLLAFCEGGSMPKIFVYSVKSQEKPLFTLSDCAELELADLAFDRSGSRLYALARATSKKLAVFSMLTGELLKGCELRLPLRFDKLSVYPGHKDHLAVIRGSAVRIVSITKSYETYITKLLPSGIPMDADLPVSAYCWTSSGHLLIALRQGLLCTLNGATGSLAHVCQSDQPITSVGMTRSHIVTSHIGNTLSYWSFDPEAVGANGSEIVANFLSDTGEVPGMSAAASGGVFRLRKVIDLNGVDESHQVGQRMLGQVACVQVTPEFDHVVLTTAEGEVWEMDIPAAMNLEGVPIAEASEELEEEDIYMSTSLLNMRMLAWFHTHSITDVCSLGADFRVCASCDEGGRLRVWQVAPGRDLKGFRMLRFTSGLTSLASDHEGKFLFASTDSGCVHVLSCIPWFKMQVIDTLRISELGIAKLRTCTAEDGMAIKFAALLFNNRITFGSFSLRDSKLKMFGFLEPLGFVEDICWHDKDGDDTAAPKLLAVGSYGEIPCLWAVRSPREGFEAHSVDIEREFSPVWTARLGSDKRPEEKPTSVVSLTSKAVSIGFAGGAVRSYAVPTSMGTTPGKSTAAVSLSILDHGSQQFITSLYPSSGKATLALSSMDGSIQQFSVTDTAVAVLKKNLHSPYGGGASQVISSPDGEVLITTGGSDGLLLWSAPGSGVTLTPGPEDATLEAAAMEQDDGLGEQPNDFVLEFDDTDLAAFPVWVPTAPSAAEVVAAEEEELELSEEAMANRKLLTSEILALRKRLRVLVDHNGIAPDLEKLDRKEFCVDFEERDVIAAKSKEACDALRAKIEHENTARQLVRDRLIKEFWDPMSGKGCQITSFMSNLAVANYPARTTTEEETTVAKKLRLLRKSEQLELQMLRTPAECPAELQHDLVLEEDHFTTGREQYVVNWWPQDGTKAAAQRAQQSSETQAEEKRLAQIAKEKADKEAEKQKEKDAKQKDKDKDGDKDKGRKEDDFPKPVEPAVDRSKTTADAISTQEEKFLYEPFELVTNCRRRLQIHLLQCLSAEYRTHFNEIFKACQDDKKNIADGIKEKCQRIKSILGELQIDEQVPMPVMPDVEDPEFVLNVKDSEIVAEKWISPEERKIMEEAAAKEEERLRQLRENDAGQRALVQMMGGTLKTKKDLSPLELVLDKELWMDEIPEEDMTDVQKEAFAEFQAKEKALAEEQEKYRQQLHAELRQLRYGVQELTVQFEGLLKKLHHERFAHDTKFFCQELYCARLQLALLQSVEDSMVRDQAQFDVEAAQKRVKEAEAKLQDFTEEVNNAKGTQDDRVRYEKEVASAQHFRQAFANSALEPNAITALLQLFRKRRAGGPQVSGMRGSISSSQLLVPKIEVAAPSYNPFDAAAAGDPYSDLGVPENREDSRSDAHADDEPKLSDCPENSGVDEASFQKMLELRSEKLRAEHEVAKGSAILAEMEGLKTHLKLEAEQAQEEYKRLERELAEHTELMGRELYDIEVLFKLKQGQVEVPQAAVVTDYSDAIVIGHEVVESRNGRIQELGKNKVAVMNTIKEFRKKLSLLEWEHSMLGMQTTDLEERTKDVHMLRVTKDLQSQLRGGEEGRNKAESDLLERKIEHLNDNTEKKEAALKKQYAMGAHAAKLRKSENAMLEKKLRELQQNVIQREHIRRLRAPAGGGGGDKPARGNNGRVEENEGAAKAAQAAFREVRNRRKLMETAKQHTQEIELLHKELDRLRQKTFPSFVQLHEDRPANPDHIG